MYQACKIAWQLLILKGIGKKKFNDIFVKLESFLPKLYVDHRENESRMQEKSNQFLTDLLCLSIKKYRNLYLFSLRL